MPARLYPAFRAALDTFHAMEFEGPSQDPQRFQQSMLERFLTQPATATREDVDYLLEKMDRLAARTGPAPMLGA